MKYKNLRTGRVVDAPDPSPDDDEFDAQRKAQMLVVMDASKKWQRCEAPADDGPDPAEETPKNDPEPADEEPVEPADETPDDDAAPEDGYNPDEPSE